MPTRTGWGDVVLEAADSKPSRELDPDRDFSMLILGDFSGRANPPERLEPVRIDIDNFDGVLSWFDVSLVAAGVRLRFDEIEDFHPNCILRNSGVRAAAESLPVEPVPAAVKSDPAPPAGSGNLLEAMLEKVQGPGPVALPPISRPKDTFAELLEQVTRPHLETAPDPRAREVESALARQLRAILHDPAFQALEATWRGLEFLVRSIDWGSPVRLSLMDVDLAGLRTDPVKVVHAVRSAAAKGPYAVIAGLYQFGDSVEDLVLLSTLGQLAAAEGVSFLAGASSRLLGCESLAQSPDPGDWQPLPDLLAKVWDAIRQGQEAKSIGLLEPRFLLRMPYGRETDPVDRLAFEEFPEAPLQEHYLWGHPAFACLSLLAASFSEDGWNMRPGRNLRIGNRPLHIYKKDGEAVAQPCAEALLSDNAIEAILDRGLMPLAPVRNQDAFWIARMQSIADPPTGLSGSWIPG